MLSPIENLKIYSGINYRIFRNNKLYYPKEIKNINEYKFNNFKPGFYRQSINFKEFLKGKKILNNIKFSKQIISLIEKIIF